MRAEKNGNAGKCEVSVWTRAITANSEWPDKVNITFDKISPLKTLFKGKEGEREKTLPKSFHPFSSSRVAGGVSRCDILGEAGDRYYCRCRMGPYTSERFYSSIVVSKKKIEPRDHFEFVSRSIKNLPCAIYISKIIYF